MRVAESHVVIICSNITGFGMTTRCSQFIDHLHKQPKADCCQVVRARFCRLVTSSPRRRSERPCAIFAAAPGAKPTCLITAMPGVMGLLTGTNSHPRR